MQAGQLSKRIKIQSQSSTQDELGAPIQTWTTAYECWANINPKSGRQLFSAGEFTAKTTLDIIVRWARSFEFQPNQRVTYTDALSTHIYNIESVSNLDQSNKTVTLSVYELNGAE